MAGGPWGRRCHNCGRSMTPFAPRKRSSDKERMLCPSCKKAEEWRESYAKRSALIHLAEDQEPESDDPKKGSVEEDPYVLQSATASLRRQAHDSGDSATLFHCPFCGSGQLTARSDNSTECDYCDAVFTVQVQPQKSGHPQTVLGQPMNVPGMPGQVGVEPDGTITDAKGPNAPGKNKSQGPDLPNVVIPGMGGPGGPSSTPPPGGGPPQTGQPTQAGPPGTPMGPPDMPASPPSGGGPPGSSPPGQGGSPPGQGGGPPGQGGASSPGPQGGQAAEQPSGGKSQQAPGLPNQTPGQQQAAPPPGKNAPPQVTNQTPGQQKAAPPQGGGAPGSQGQQDKGDQKSDDKKKQPPPQFQKQQVRRQADIFDDRIPLNGYKEHGYRQGYDDAMGGMPYVIPKLQGITPEQQDAWREGYDLGHEDGMDEAHMQSGGPTPGSYGNEARAGGPFTSRRRIAGDFLRGTGDSPGYGVEIVDPDSDLGREMGDEAQGYAEQAKQRARDLYGDDVGGHYVGWDEIGPAMSDATRRYWEKDPGESELGAKPDWLVTHQGTALPLDAYIRYLALRFADDREGVIDQIRTERGLPV